MILPLFNIILYYWGSFHSSEVNELEIYWPLALIISCITVLNVCQTFIGYRNLCKKNEPMQNAYTKANLELLEAKSKPNLVLTHEMNTTEQTPSQKFIIYETLHPTLVQKSVTQSLTQHKRFYEFFDSSSDYLRLVCAILLSLIIGGSHSFIPTISRGGITVNESSEDRSRQINCMRISYIVLSLIFYWLLTAMMMASIFSYLRILNILKKLLASTELIQGIDIEAEYYLNIREPKNLEYFLSLFQKVKENIDPYHIFLSTMACAVIIDSILILTVVIHVFIYGYSTGLLTIWCLIDIFVLSVFIVVFLGIVVLINKLLTRDFILHLKKLKKTIIQENDNTNINYLNVVIDHMESASQEYAVKLFGFFVVDHKLALKVILGILSSFGSAFVVFLENR